MHAAERYAEYAQRFKYERHHPEETVLHRVVSTYWPEFRERVEALGSLPKFVVRDVDESLRCGILEHGFIRVQCRIAGLSDLCAMFVTTFIRELQRIYRWRAKREFGLSSVEDAFTGMVTVIQRFDSALRLNVHFHTLAFGEFGEWKALRVGAGKAFVLGHWLGRGTFGNAL